MARILYGVMGDARGHVSRALTVAQQMRGHEFLFLGGGRVHDLKAEGYSVEDIPMLGTFYKNNTVDIPATVANALKVFLKRSAVKRKISEIIESFDPHLVLTDYEYFAPLAARSKGRACVSLDHQHILTHCKYEAPPGDRLGRLTTRTVMKRLFSNAAFFLIISFYSLPALDPETTRVLPTIVRSAVTSHAASDGDHVLVYQTSPTLIELIPVLEQTKHRCLIYGFGDVPSRKNLVFKPFSTESFLQDLASCRYAIINGGHNVISEALYFGKPILSFPIRHAYEQYLNAHFLAKLSYGEYCTDRPSPNIVESFESRLDLFKSSIASTFRAGNQELVDTLEGIIASA